MKNFLLFVCIAAALSSCTIAKISGRGPVPLMLNQPNEKIGRTQHYTAQKAINFDFTNSFDVSEVLSRQRHADDADKIINIEVTIKTTAGNFFLNLITFGLANSRTVVIEYDVVKK